MHSLACYTQLLMNYKNTSVVLVLLIQKYSEFFTIIIRKMYIYIKSEESILTVNTSNTHEQTESLCNIKLIFPINWNSHMHSMSCSLDEERFSLVIKFHLIQCLLCIQQFTKLSPSNLKQHNKLNIVRCTCTGDKSFTIENSGQHTRTTCKGLNRHCFQA